MADIYSKTKRSEIMAAVRSRGNKATEIALVRLLRRHKLWGWRRHVSLAGKPDFVFPEERVAVFVDGCFWHGCPRCYRLPDDNRPYWKAKVQTNRGRDRRRTRELRSLNWQVLRFWEHSLKSVAGRRQVLSRLKLALNRRSAMSRARVREQSPTKRPSRRQSF